MILFNRNWGMGNGLEALVGLSIMHYKEKKNAIFWSDLTVRMESSR